MAINSRLTQETVHGVTSQAHPSTRLTQETVHGVTSQAHPSTRLTQVALSLVVKTKGLPYAYRGLHGRH